MARLAEPYFYEIVGLKLTKWCSMTERSIRKQERSNDEKFMERVANFARRSVVRPLLSIQDRSDSADQQLESGAINSDEGSQARESRPKEKKKKKKSKRDRSKSNDKSSKRKRKGGSRRKKDKHGDGEQ